MKIKRVIDGREHTFELTEDELLQSFTDSLEIVYRNAVEFTYESMDELTEWARKSEENADRYNECVDDAVSAMLWQWENYEDLLDEERIKNYAWDALHDSGIESEIYDEEA